MAGRAAVVVALFAFALAGCGGSATGEHSASAGKIVELAGVEQLRAAFSANQGTARLILLLSPT
jgi:hypothetical protein